MDWDPLGDILAVCNDENGDVCLWDCSNKKMKQIDINMKGITCCKWSQSGNLVFIIYN
jgi:WD40 repeat protein